MDKRQVYRVCVLTISGNLLLAVLKFAAGFFGRSQALISDAVNSATDVVSTAVMLLGINMSAKKSDSSHPYGHERIESVFAIILAMMIFVTGLGIGVSALRKIVSGAEIVMPGKIALFAAVVSIIVKEIMYRYTKHNAIKLNSSAMMATAWDHRSDALSSIGSLIGVGGAILGYTVLEPIASIVICIFIGKAAVSIFIDAVNRLIDRACTDEEVEKIRACILEVRGVKRIDKLMTRRFGAKIYVDLEIAEAPDLTLLEAHTIAEQVHDNIESKIENVKHCMIHVNPFTE